MNKLVISVALAGALFVLPSVSEAALGDQTLREGLRHGDVQELQEVLRRTGHFDFQTSTGYFGSVTRQAVRDFQRSKGITVDGIAGSQTFNALGISNRYRSSLTNNNAVSVSFIAFY
ncbi:peptidoglycan-binding domain-containing protein [Alkalihalobacillus deserti]|uniref:peptidoglycan-binding domain-containing protein n=1 Tax=Alkalihalobacillus deserti TaxID=2879466 RepID=UPI001D138546|nr:peptidoglycan-binding domain-containing protein [Alkalihalobacillus deserti]